MADDITKRIARFIEPLQVSPGSHVKLAKDFDPAFRAGIEKKKDGVGLLNDGIAILSDYQRKLAAQATQGVVVVLQALDAAGKDGTIRHVMSGVNPQGVRVESFKVPSAAQLDQDYLRRYQERLPARGEIGIFNRSHYEEVLVVRVHPENLIAQKLPGDHHVWKHRYHAINEWERYLTDNGFRIVKLFLNLSKEEQRRRFLRRIDLPEHNWKFLRPRRAGAPVLGRLPGRLLGDVDAHEHRVGAVVRHPGRPQVVRPRRRRRGHRAGAHRHRPALPEGRRPRAARAPGGEARARGRGARGCARGSLRD
jgi:PPK2 family polyphosphate:nucleotide phosphotransferase